MQDTTKHKNLFEHKTQTILVVFKLLVLTDNYLFLISN